MLTRNSLLREIYRGKMFVEFTVEDTIDILRERFEAMGAKRKKPAGQELLIGRIQDNSINTKYM